MGYQDRILTEHLTQLRADGSDEALATATELERSREEELAGSDDDDQLQGLGFDPTGLRAAYADGPPAGTAGDETVEQLVNNNTREELDGIARGEGLDPDFDTKAQVAEAIVEARAGK